MNYAVLGGNFGDEGKGITVDYLCSKVFNPLVVRFSGGQNAGHTVKSSVSHVFSNFGSGSLAGVPTYWSEHCCVDPMGIIKELKELTRKGINPKLYINGKCPVTTPYDKLSNQLNRASINHGTCGVGVGATFQREADHYSLTFSDLFNSTVMEFKLKLVQQYYGITCNPEIDEFRNYIYDIRKLENIELVYDIPNFPNYIFEGSQGLLLDQNYGFFPNVTRANTGTKNIVQFKPEMFLVTRAYLTRHGNGMMSQTEINLRNTEDETNVYHKYQGEFRKSVLDLDLLKYGIYKDDYIRNNIHLSTLVITCLDQLMEYKLIYNSLIHSFTKENFIQFIYDSIKPQHILISESPYSTNLVQWK